MDLLAVQGTVKSLLQHHSSKASILRPSAFFIVQVSHPYMTTGKTIALTRRTFVGKVAMQETWVRSLGGEDPLDKGMATHSSVLACLENSVDSIVHGVTKSWPPGSCVHGIVQAGILEWVAIPFSRRSS